jgi:hypothetical protein
VMRVTSSQKLHQEETEHGRIDTTGYVRPFYPKIIVSSVLYHSRIIIFYFFTWAYK